VPHGYAPALLEAGFAVFSFDFRNQGSSDSLPGYHAKHWLSESLDPWFRKSNQNTANPGWLHDVGFGLRFLNARTAFGQVLHADIAFPLNRDGDIKPAQFVLKTKVAL
jgi:hypothetical protein